MPRNPKIIAALVLAGMIPTGAAPPPNPIYDELVTSGFDAGGTRVRLPGPSFADGQDAEAGMAALRQVAGDDRAARELLRDSVTAPFILKSRDVKAEGVTIRSGDLWFVVHARLEDFDPERAARQAGDQEVEAGNMRIGSKLLKEDDLRAQGTPLLAPEEGRQEWFTHLTGRLLDRIGVEVTERAVATRAADSIVIASRTDPAFDRDEHHPNHWTNLAHKGAETIPGQAHPYRGGASYVKVTRLAAMPGALLVEAHFAFVEPLEWFQGNPILRSKIGLIAQEKIRGLRRELATRRAKP